MECDMECEVIPLALELSREHEHSGGRSGPFRLAARQHVALMSCENTPPRSLSVRCADAAFRCIDCEGGREGAT